MAGKKKYRKADCHPDRPHKAFGLCHKCYEKQRYESDTEKHKIRAAKWKRDNADRVLNYRKKYHAENLEKERERYRRYDGEHREERKKKAEEYVKNHPDYRSYQREWAKKNPEKVKAKRHRRRARLEDVISSVEEWDIKRRAFLFGYLCAYCGNPYESIDHVIPISHGGNDIPSNLVPSCSRCNSSKRDNNWIDWYRKQTFYSVKRKNFIKDNTSNV